MITRIVKMTFKKNQVAKFLKIFVASKNKILAFEGCTHLELLTDIHQPNVFFTYSLWNSEADLLNYRN